jgi:prepilin-type N-terminal cleavage/methylation domain-containing protein
MARELLSLSTRERPFSRRPTVKLRNQTGVTLIELVVVLAVVSALIATATVGIASWARDQRLKTSARAVSDAFTVGRAEAIRTGDSHLVVFGLNALANANADIVIVNDDRPDLANCSIASSEIVHRVALENGVTWGTTASLAGTTVAPGDQGLAVGNTQFGSSFTTAALDPNTAASWVVFQPDGVPLLFSTNGSDCTQIGIRGEGGGAIYVTNGRRDYAIVLTPLGTSRVLGWNPSSNTWMN